ASNRPDRRTLRSAGVPRPRRGRSQGTQPARPPPTHARHPPQDQRSLSAVADDGRSRRRQVLSDRRPSAPAGRAGRSRSRGKPARIAPDRAPAASPRCPSCRSGANLRTHSNARKATRGMYDAPGNRRRTNVAKAHHRSRLASLRVTAKGQQGSVALPGRPASNNVLIPDRLIMLCFTKTNRTYWRRGGIPRAFVIKSRTLYVVPDRPTPRF